MPEDPDVEDGELAGRADIAGRLDDVEWIRHCADWLEHLDREPYPAMVNLRLESDWPRRFHVAADLPRVVSILRRIGYDIHELARARRVADLDSATTGGPGSNGRIFNGLPGHSPARAAVGAGPEIVIDLHIRRFFGGCYRNHHQWE